MKRTIVFCLVLFILVAGGMAALAKGNGEEKKLTAKEILNKVETQNDAKDQTSAMKMILVDKKGKENIREVKLWTKGDYKRLIKFISPADVKGVGFLVLDADLDSEKMYLYLPAFKKVRRIAGSAKGGSFMGSDFSYSDIGSSNYSQDYDAKRLQDENSQYVLELKRKKGSDKDYAKLVMRVSSDVFVPTRIEFYEIKKVEKEEKLDLRKIMTAENIKKIGKYWIPQKITMEDVKKKHQTVMELSEIEFDTGFSDELFTERYLQR